MYVKNIQTTYFINNKKSNKNKLSIYKDNVSEVFKKFQEVSSNLGKILENNILTQIDKELITVRDAQNNVQRSAVYVDTELLNEQDRNGQKVEIDRNLQDMDDEEIMYPILYQMRKKCENLLDAIEKAYSDDVKDILARFVRFSANKRDFNALAPKKSGLSRAKTFAVNQA
jgi:hypothetical protein